ncbi:flavin-containing monooxygenase [Gordonia sp. SL306]|uniref:flavin-containing monooxygenase n=1 Tax=Gordonia sp. SL306 TaxID=2995145 RepID=UPI002270E0FF|nr:NAD(P)/FAD-dependent oxidoreductase [Gordonia sp. SL306]WAC57017.1 NAD(P)/FAD-dependent oxidoreductase [Gordonia sp. SL306]
MTQANTQVTATNAGGEVLLDAFIVGCGVSGIEALHRLRSAGFDAIAVDAADGVGGTWHWNRYPGARLDSESYSYGYFFSEELRNGWDWSEHFCSQPENERYFNYVVDALDLRPFMKLGTAVTSAHWDPDGGIWLVTTADGDRYRTRFLITGIGILSDPKYPNIPGRERFSGAVAHTARWPKGGLDLKDKRVAVIGTGSSGVQTIAAIGPIVGSLTVFQRSPNWCPPLNNEPITPLEMAEIKGQYEAIWTKTRTTRGGFIHGPIAASAFSFSPEERRQWYETLYGRRGFARLYTNFIEVIRTKELNAEFSEFLAEKIRERVEDPDVAKKLIPVDHGFGQRRPPYETGYYEVYNQPNVELVDTTETPLVEITENGIRTTEREFEFDVIIYATGFNSVTGAFDRIDIQGRDGASLGDAWRQGPNTVAGLGTHGFPNLLMLGGPQAMGGNIPRCIEHQALFLDSLMRHMRDNGLSRIEPTQTACDEWTAHVAEVVSMTLYAETKSGWFWNAVEGATGHSFGIYPAGVVEYGRRLREIEANGYQGFVLS